MFSYEEALELLEELHLPKNDENIKWAYEMLIKETKLEVKIRKYEKKYNECFFDDDCECEDGSCCNGSCSTNH